ncbi:hypothetical protein AAMO2058_001292800 [Amorphochlora amoebiformis]
MLAPLVLGFALVGAVHQGVPTEIEDGYYNGRSGDVIFMPSDLPDDTVMTLFGDRVTAETPRSISIKEVRDIVSQSFGLTGAREHSFVKDEVFNRPNLNFMLVVHGIGGDTISMHKLHNLMALVGNHPRIDLKDICYPRSPLSLSVTVTTGEMPAVHGIVADTWVDEGEKQTAYTNGNHASVANLADLTTQYFGDESLAISMSSSREEAFAFAPHTITKNSYTAFYDPKAKEFVFDHHASPELTWSFAATLKSIENSDVDQLWNRIKMNGGEVFYDDTLNSFVVKSGSSASSVHFRLNEEAEAAVFAELIYAKTLIKKLGTSTKFTSLMSDNTPDIISLSFRSPVLIGERYGYESKQYKATLNLFDSALPLLIHRLEELAQTSHVGELILMGSPVIIDKEAISGLEKHLSLESDSEFLPSLYVESGIDPAHTCKTLRMNLDAGTSGLKTFCPAEIRGEAGLESLIFASSSTSLGATAGTSSNITSEQLIKFQIVLWISLAAFFTLLAVVVSFGCMEYDRDTLLFSKRRIKEPGRSG